MALLNVGDVLENRYRIEAPIASGGMSSVYRCTDLRLGRQVAAKVMHEQFANDAVFTQRFRREAIAMAQLNHPNIVGVHDYGTDGEQVFLIMDLIDGGTLRELLDERGPMPPHAAAAVMQAVLRGLEVAHQAGLVHRDIKPDNVLIHADHQVKLADFGLVRAARASQGPDYQIVGTVSYLSPEQVTGQEIGPQSDVYAAGILLFELLTGSTPFSGDTALDHAYARVSESVPQPSSKISGVPRLFDELVASATALNPTERFQDASEFLAAITDVAEELQLPAFQVPVPSNTAANRAQTYHAGLDRESLLTTTFPATTNLGGAAGTTGAAGTAGTAGTAASAAAGAGAAAAAAGAAAAAASAASAAGDSAGDDQHTTITPPPVSRDRANETSVLDVHAIENAQADLHSSEQPGAPVVPPGYAVPPATAHMPSPESLPYTSTEASAHASAAPARRPETIAPAKPVTNRSVGSTIFWWLLVVLFTIALALGGWWFGSGRYGEIPQVLGMDEVQAVAVVEEAGFVAHTTGAYDNDVPKDQAVGTVPAFGEREVKGRTIDVVLSLGLPTVPGFSEGATYEQYAATLKEYSLTAVPGESDFDDDAPAGTIVRTEPAVGTEVAAGSSVTVVVSRGPAPTTIPNVEGLSTEEAHKKLEDAGLKISERHEFSNKVPGDHAVSTNPAAGTTLPRGSEVTLVISTSTEIPNVIGLERNEAISVLADAGIVVREVVRDEGDVGGSAEEITSISPDVGSLIDSSETQVTLHTPGLVEVPRVVGSKLEDAIERLEDAGFVVRNVDTSQKSARVYWQSPSGGRAEPGSAISLRVVGS